MLKKGAGGWKKVAAFGDDILQADGEVDRPRLGQIVFTVPAKCQLLNRYGYLYAFQSLMKQSSSFLFNAES